MPMSDHIGDFKFNSVRNIFYVWIVVIGAGTYVAARPIATPLFVKKKILFFLAKQYVAKTLLSNEIVHQYWWTISTTVS